MLCGEAVVGDAPFAVILADDLIDAQVPVMRQMVEVAARMNASTIGVMEVPVDAADRYGIVETEPTADRVGRITRIVEKPKVGTTRSTLAVIGRYVLSPQIFRHLRETPPGAGGEIQLTDGIARLVAEEAVFAYAFDGRRYDCGSKQGYLEASVDFGLKHPEAGAGFARFLAQRFKEPVGHS